MSLTSAAAAAALDWSCMGRKQERREDFLQGRERVRERERRETSARATAPR